MFIWQTLYVLPVNTRSLASLIGFSQNVASDWSPERALTSKSGTLAYLAPEVYGGRGYGSEVDWWSLGVLFYECIYSMVCFPMHLSNPVSNTKLAPQRPFEGNTHDSLARDIVKANPKYPVTQPPVSMPCVHAIRSLLEKDKRNRIGAAGFHTFTESIFFQRIDFELLEQKEVEPIFKPSSEKTNFDATYDLEELLLEEAPLEARARRQRPREQLKEDATEKEIREDGLHRMIESLFEPFDYTAISYDKYGHTFNT
jgi:serine/threonine kinase 32